jgi:hypothetical protein
MCPHTTCLSSSKVYVSSYSYMCVLRSNAMRRVQNLCYLLLTCFTCCWHALLGVWQKRQKRRTPSTELHVCPVVKCMCPHTPTCVSSEAPEAADAFCWHALLAADVLYLAYGRSARSGGRLLQNFHVRAPEYRTSEVLSFLSLLVKWTHFITAVKLHTLLHAFWRLQNLRNSR